MFTGSTEDGLGGSGADRALHLTSPVVNLIYLRK